MGLKLPLCGLALALAATPLLAQETGLPPLPKPMAQRPLDPDAIPLFPDQKGSSLDSEIWSDYGGHMRVVRNVTLPTITPVLPDADKANGAAVVVAPGGGFMMLAWDHEGTKVARALADRGITAFILKYRTLETPADGGAAMQFIQSMIAKEVAMPMQGPLMKQALSPVDARVAVAMVRANASKWHIDPKRVGMIGFSAGAMTSRRVAIDAPASERPDFIGYIYGPQDAETVPADAPPMFDAIALDDALFPSKGFAIAQEWLKARRPVEIHGYQKGNHGFGLGVPGTTTTLVIDEFVSWLAMNQFLSPAKK